MRARKRFGQHFLHDPNVLGRIASAISPRPGDHVVEIGPGRGALTHALLEDWLELAGNGDATSRRESAATGVPDANAGQGQGESEGATLDLIEIDRDLVPRLRS